MKRALNFMNKGSQFSFLLDDYPTAKIAYSFRKLRSAYSGNCIEVRRSSDNTTSNIGFVNNVLDEAALLSFVGAGDGFVKTWYDQSGNANNLTAASDAAQPRIVTSGVVEKQNGKTAIYSTTAMTMSCSNFSQTYDSAFTVCKITSTTTTIIPFTTALNTGGAYYGLCTSGSVDGSFSSFVNPAVYKNGGATALVNTRGVFYTNFITNNIFLISQFSPSVLTSFNRGTQYFVLKSSNFIQEHITYISNQTSNKSGIESSINAFYGIY